MEQIFSKPNQITFIRILLIPLFVIFLLIEIPYNNYIAAFIFVILSLSDFLDGYIARKKHQVTKFGGILDPIADKLLISAALIFLIGKGMPVWMVVVIIAREWAITMLRFIVLPKQVIPAGKLGKIKTITQIVAIISVIINFPFNWYLMLAAVIITVVSGLEYLIRIRNILDEKILNIPNVITFMRLGLLPLFVLMILNLNLNYALIIFAVIAISDKFDGVSARIMNQMTEFGKAFDSFTDWSVFLISFVALVIKGYLDLIWILLLILPAIIISLSKLFLLKKQEKMPVTPIARVSVGITYVTIIAILINFIYKEQVLIVAFIFIYLSMFRYISLLSKMSKSIKQKN
jgi:CDP-diacylglycerol--glycerol-3-phosphate 3-phosphatidyltransferase|tara:strand:- start:473 stop:1513 length:1041 start_codon:yes stop_codon:yes gene_type:complete